MSTKRIALSRSPLAAALQAALATLAIASLGTVARADDDLAALVNPTNTVEIGGTYTQHSSYKFGEYNGLPDSGLSLIGNVDVRGGDAYGQKPGTMRWSINGRDLGTTSRSIGARISNQGSWKLGVSYDQLRHNITDSYQTPLQGSMGGNTFTMPAGFGVVNKSRGAPGTQALTPTQQSFFHTQDVYSQRGTTRFTAEHNLGRQWDLRFHWTHIDQSGAKLIGSGTDEQTTSQAFLNAGYKPGNESIQLLMNPTESKTDNFDLSANWAGAKGFFTGSFFGSRYRDDNSALYFPNPYTLTNVPNGSPVAGGDFPVDLMSTPPNNEDKQISLSGGYDLTERTKLVGGYSYGRNTQNMAYVYEPAEMQGSSVPVGSLNGLVVNTHADARLTNRTTDALTLSGGVIYNKRDNQTPSYAYPFYTLGGDSATPVNMPESYSTTKTDVAGDYRLSTRQHVHLGLQNNKTRRWCDNTAAIALGESLAAAVASYYTPGSTCAQVPEESENRVVTLYRVQAAPSLNLRAGYTYSNRKSTVNPSFYNPMQSFSEGFENYGYLAYFDASRREHLFRAGANWQATSALNLSLDGQFTDDQYGDSTLGVQNGHSANVNLDSNYQFSQDASMSAYVSWQWRTRDLLSATGRNAVSTAGLTYWTNGMRDQATTIGLTAKRRGLMAGKLTVAADLSYSIDTTTYNTESAGGASGIVCNTGSASGFNCGQIPDIRSELTRLTLTGNYAIDKKSSVLFGYLHEKLNSNDYLFNFYQTGYTSSAAMPANLQNPSYTQNVLFLSYIYRFM